MLSTGHGSVTTTFSWTLLHTIRSGLFSELCEHKSRHLLEAIFREIGRLYSNLFFIRRVTSSQVIRGKHIPNGTYIACSPLVTARDPRLFTEPNHFRPQRWMTPTHHLDNTKLRHAQKVGTSTQFGKGEHLCLGQNLGRVVVLDTLWDVI